MFGAKCELQVKVIGMVFKSHRAQCCFLDYLRGAGCLHVALEEGGRMIDCRTICRYCFNSCKYYCVYVFSYAVVE